MMKRMSSEAEWRAYISAFVEANKGKRKLMEKMRKVKLNTNNLTSPRI